MEYDYGDDAQPEPSLSVAQKLMALVREQSDAQNEVERAEAVLEAAKERLKVVCEIEIPRLMREELGSDEFRIEGGPKIKIKKTIRATLPKEPDKRGAAFAWLEGNGHAMLIKDEIELSFGRGDHDRADAAVVLLQKAGIDYGRKLDIHNQTLCKFLREALAEGENVPLELFGVFEQVKAEIKF